MRNEIEKIRRMPPKERWEYFRTYYLVQTVIGVIVLILAAFFIHDMKVSSREILASGCLVNVTIDQEGFFYLTDEYISFCEKSQKEASAFLSVDNTLDFMPENPLDKDSYVMALTAQIYAGDYQYMILDKEAWEYFQKSDVYADLTQMLTPEQQEKYADRMVYQTYQTEDGTQGRIATALDLTGTAFAGHCHLEPQTAYLVFIETAQEENTEITVEKKRRLADYILSDVSFL
ncbi:MAG: hypothetical protein NC314_03920 [Roseburia sp.]|nr:hypothetical protein [Roseburia sp.]MCM1241964.1 hypothetical protein [Roseburia sp.]